MQYHEITFFSPDGVGRKVLEAGGDGLFPVECHLSRPKTEPKRRVMLSFTQEFIVCTWYVLLTAGWRDFSLIFSFFVQNGRARTKGLLYLHQILTYLNQHLNL